MEHSEILVARLRLLGDVLAETPSLLQLADKVSRAAQSKVAVLLSGETGTGKTLLARTIHCLSPWSREHFVEFSCSSMRSDLVASELFGHEVGANAGAKHNTGGKFVAAGNGTLLLRQIGSLGYRLSTKLLRVVETGEYEPIGSSHSRPFSCRLIMTCTCNLDVEREVTQGRLPADLYEHLKVVTIYLRPLRERLTDIESLARAFVARACAKFGKEMKEISNETLVALQAYTWPGNVRELEGILQHGVVLSRSRVLRPCDLPEHVRKLDPCESSVLERLVLIRTLGKNRHNRTRTAQAMGISRTGLYNKLKRYGLMSTPPEAEGLAPPSVGG